MKKKQMIEKSKKNKEGRIVPFVVNELATLSGIAEYRGDIIEDSINYVKSLPDDMSLLEYISRSNKGANSISEEIHTLTNALASEDVNENDPHVNALLRESIRYWNSVGYSYDTVVDCSVRCIMMQEFRSSCLVLLSRLINIFRTTLNITPSELQDTFKITEFGEKLMEGLMYDFRRLVDINYIKTHHDHIRDFLTGKNNNDLSDNAMTGFLMPYIDIFTMQSLADVANYVFDYVYTILIYIDAQSDKLEYGEECAKCTSNILDSLEKYIVPILNEFKISLNRSLYALLPILAANYGITRELVINNDIQF